MTPEADVLRAAIEAFAIYGVDPERQNTGAMVNPKGQPVRFGRPGNSDLRGIFPVSFGNAAGRAWMCEVKRGDFDPRKLSESKRCHFDRQLYRLRACNASGGYAWWINDASQVVFTLERIRLGWRVEIDEDGMPWVTNEDLP